MDGKRYLEIPEAPTQLRHRADVTFSSSQVFFSQVLPYCMQTNVPSFSQRFYAGLYTTILSYFIKFFLSLFYEKRSLRK